MTDDLAAKLRPTLATPRTVACQAPLSMGFSRQEYWSGLPFPSPGDLADLGIEPRSSLRHIRIASITTLCVLGHYHVK